jgi:hypothetical protein
LVAQAVDNRNDVGYLAIDILLLLEQGVGVGAHHFRQGFGGGNHVGAIGRVRRVFGQVVETLEKIGKADHYIGIV